MQLSGKRSFRKPLTYAQTITQEKALKSEQSRYYFNTDFSARLIY